MAVACFSVKLNLLIKLLIESDLSLLFLMVVITSSNIDIAFIRPSTI